VGQPLDYFPVASYHAPHPAAFAQFQFFYDLGIGSLAPGALLDLARQDFSIMYAATALVALLGLWIYWRRD
jgi:hypothetical protein